ncbi:unnamed protein product [Ectocarpus sp. CCAP 1310/34]|nr:unnamed protein product [Ectocarpus sp. CCAP 1310/34]
MAELVVGQRVKVRPKAGPAQEGVVYTHDALTNTITIKQDIPNTKTHSAILVYNRAHVQIDVVPGAPVVDDCMALPNISGRELDRKENKALQEATKAWAQINPGATNEGQAIFDLFTKTLDCSWSDQSIVILESVRIDPPYTADNCRSLDGDKPGLDRALLMLGKFRNQLEGPKSG